MLRSTRLVSNRPDDRETAVNVTATLSPDQLARACADAMWAEDDASSGLGMEIVDVGPGRATLAMTVKPQMVNGQRIDHGGLILLLAELYVVVVCKLSHQHTLSRRQ